MIKYLPKFALTILFVLSAIAIMVEIVSDDIKDIEARADKGDVEAQILLAELYVAGESVPQDLTEAFKWYSKAAKLGNQGAINIVGIMYANGSGVEQDDVQAYAHFLTGASLGFKSSIENKEKHAPKLTPEQMAEAEALAETMTLKLVVK